MIWLALAAAGLALTAAGAAASLRLASPVAFGLAAYVAACAQVVVLTEILSLFDAVGAAGYGVGQALLLGAAAAVWTARGRPRPALPRIERGAVRRHPVLAALVVVVAAGFLYQAFLVAETPPNNWDSMTYHLSRAAGWYQHGAVEYLAAHTERQNGHPPNGEIEILWTFAFLGRDALAAAPQLLAELALLGAVYACARRLGAARSAALFAALLLATLTEVALQSVTTQNDLVVASFIAVAAAFVLGRDRRELALAGIAVGLAVGTKLTALLALPLLALLALAVLRPRGVVRLAAWSAAGVAALGFYGYALNLAEAGSLDGRLTDTEVHRPSAVTASGTVSTAARIAWRFVDVSGYHPHAVWLARVTNAGYDLFDWLGIEQNPPESTTTPFIFRPNESVNEDVSFFGPLGILLVLPLSLVFLAGAALRRVDRARAVLALALPLYVVEIALVYRYNAWLGRFLIAPVALVLPLAAWLYPLRLLSALAALVGAATLALAHAFNVAKPAGLDGTRPVWTLSRPEAQALTRPALEPALVAVDRDVPEDAAVGHVLGEEDWDYPLYGRRLERRLVALPRGDPLAAAEARALRWVVAGEEAPRAPERPGWSARRLAESGWTLYSREGAT